MLTQISGRGYHPLAMVSVVPEPMMREVGAALRSKFLDPDPVAVAYRPAAPRSRARLYCKILSIMAAIAAERERA